MLSIARAGPLDRRGDQPGDQETAIQHDCGAFGTDSFSSPRSVGVTKMKVVALGSDPVLRNHFDLGCALLFSA
jgi:hypothetical protein